MTNKVRRGNLPRHAHTGSDSNRINYNDLTNKPSISSTTPKYAHGTLTIGVGAGVQNITGLGFEPEHIEFKAVAVTSSATDYSWSHSYGSYNKAGNTNKACALYEATNDDSTPSGNPSTSLSSSRCYALQVDVSSNLNANGSVTGTNSDGFDLTPNSTGVACVLIWNAYGFV